MLRFLRVGISGLSTAPDPIELTHAQLAGAPHLPIAIRALNELDNNIKQRLYRLLLPHRLLFQYDINPITWRGPDKETYVSMRAAEDSGTVYLEARSPFDPEDPFFRLEIEDNRFNGLDLNLLVINDPNGTRYATDVDEEGNPTLFGTLRRNQAAEEEALRAGLAPGQVRQGVRGSADVFFQLETFLIGLGHQSVYLEPLSYVSAWVFERRGFAYIQGHALMDEIHNAFQPGGPLHAALDGSSPFRQPDQWRTVRGRAWAIHDGILDTIDRRWDGLRMIKQIGRQANVNTFPDALY